jgi:hypothetical protein
MAAGATYTTIATTTLTTASASVTFSSIPGTYTDLVLVANVVAASTTYISGQVNGDTGTNYSSTYIDGSGTSATSGRTTNATSYGSARTNPDSVTIIQYMNYSNTTTYKTILEKISTAGSGVNAWVALWRNTAAITSITLFTDSANNWSAGTTFSLYGIAAA